MKQQYEKKILNLLLDKYERSAKSKGIETRRRILINEKEASTLLYYDTAEEKASAMKTLENLKNAGIITYHFIPGEEGNLIERIILNEDNVDAAYMKVSRVPEQTYINALCTVLKDVITRTAEGDIRAFLSMELKNTEKKRSYDKRYFSESLERNENMLKVLAALSYNSEIQTKRVFSTRVLGDSKRFEKETEADVLKVLRAIYGRDLTDEELLSIHGIAMYPEIIEFRGPLRIILKNGKSVDFSPLVHGSYINSYTVDEIERIETDATRVISIENKANYIDWVSKHDDNGEIVIWHGGFYSPAKSKFLKYVASSIKEWHHFSDIDIGGFRIFKRLRDNIAPYALPYMMNTETLFSNLDKAQDAKEEYIEELRTMLDDESFSIFHDVIRAMIEHKVRLEQENLI